jgi:DNA-directed RNA polymerase specialized sigma24 family protein
VTLAARIDTQRDGRELLARAARLSEREREAIELVDLMGLTPKDAAGVLRVSANVLRVRLFRAHQRLRRELDPVVVRAAASTGPTRVWPGGRRHGGRLAVG